MPHKSVLEMPGMPITGRPSIVPADQEEILFWNSAGFASRIPGFCPANF